MQFNLQNYSFYACFVVHCNLEDFFTHSKFSNRCYEVNKNFVTASFHLRKNFLFVMIKIWNTSKSKGYFLHFLNLCSSTMSVKLERETSFHWKKVCSGLKTFIQLTWTSHVTFFPDSILFYKFKKNNLKCIFVSSEYHCKNFDLLKNAKN